MISSLIVSTALSLYVGFLAPEIDRTSQSAEMWRVNIGSVTAADTVEAALQKIAEEGLSFTADAFVEACERGSAEQISLFLTAEMDPNVSDKRQNSCLIAATFEGYSDLVRHLLVAGADVDKRDRFGATPLMHAASQGYTEIARLLIEKGADVNAVDGFYDWTPLFFAAYDGYTEITAALLEAGAEPDHVSMGSDSSGKTLHTALMEAASRDYVEVVQLLLDANADVTPKSLIGETAEEMAERMGFKQITELLRERSP